jgi:hypothetical protein
MAEESLALHADLMSEASIHIALFNAYLAKKNRDNERAAEHLYQASRLIAIEQDNLRWLADFYYAKSSGASQGSRMFAERAIDSLNQFLSNAKTAIHALDENTLAHETPIVRMAELYGQLGEVPEQMRLLESLKRQYKEHPAWAWKEENRVDLMLGSIYAQSGDSGKAIDLFDKILAKNPTVRSFESASASLQSVRLRSAEWQKNNLPFDHPDTLKILSQLKTLVLQKTLANEPIHLDAALEYIDWQTRLESAEKRTSKRLALLTKMKSDFESSDDLLSEDYQKSRQALPEKDCILTAYLGLIDAQILVCQSQLAQEDTERSQYRQNAKKALEEIQERPITAFLSLKAHEQLEQMDRE